MYLPDVDSFLLIDSLKDYSGESALEIGTGTGIISKFLLKNFKNVVSTDIDYNSLLYCKQQNTSEITFICCHATTAIVSKFDLIVSSLSDISKLERFIFEEKINRKIINKKKIFYETLYVYELSTINLP